LQPPILIGDRFLANGASWIDVATGDAVRLRIAPAGEPGAQIRWSERCAVHARLRHPFLSPLVDYGAVDRERLFEAYAVLPPAHVSIVGAQRLVAQAAQFLQAHGVELTAENADLAVRAATTGSSRRGRALGIVLQDRPVHAALSDVLDAAQPGGPCHVTVCGEQGSGLRTLRIFAARAARVRGYVPLGSGVLAARPWIAEPLLQRHVCVLTLEPADAVERRALSALLLALGCTSTRRHVVISFARRHRLGWDVLPIGAMGVTAMTSMVFVDTTGPSKKELFDAARGADGLPGRFLDRLGAAVFEPHVARGLVAHEMVQPYRVSVTPPAFPADPATPVSRTGGVLSRAVPRADDLARRGRHVAATRLLIRAGRVLGSRGDANGAARCAERLGRLHMNRGQIGAALEQFERARSLAVDETVNRAATLGIANAWVDDGRLGEAEALLRSVAVTAAMEQRPDASAGHGLARCLYWQGRYAEAAVVLQPHIEHVPDLECLALAARVQIAEPTPASGLQFARRALDALDITASDATHWTAHLTMAAALSAAGDCAAAGLHVTAAIAAARRAHMPLAAIRARVTHLDVLARVDPHAPAARRLARRLCELGRQPALPRLLRFELHKTVARVLEPDFDAETAAMEQAGVRWPAAPGVGDGRSTPLSELEAMLDVCHGAVDDGDALDKLCAAAQERTRAAAVVIVTGTQRRVSGHSGRPWDGVSLAVDRALVGGTSGRSPGEPAAQSQLEAAESVKFSGEVIGAVACRWSAGTAISPERVTATLKAAALAAGAPVRAVLDRATPEAPDRAWTDLLGESAEAAAVRESTARAARAPFPVLIEGESGSGKELVARAIHRLGSRRDRRFCAVNCAALSDELLEAELFGHTRGAFTGAVGERVGLFEEADGGTLLLDEVGELSPRAQAKLLRVIQEGEIRRVGESFSRRVDVRIVAATNRRLEQETAAGRFRGDLRFRLDVIRIVLPPLRERVADIPLLAVHFWNDAARRVGSRATLAPDALAALARYDWPGNVRELQNVIAWIAVHSPRRGRIGAAALPAGVAGALSTAAVSFERAREEFERRFIRSALARANGHRASAAESLGITRQGLAKMIRRLRIDDRPFV
jgi:DNA-binding NtrC family response regulator/tetratricopeptide (TPR) repeat protein